MKLSDALPELVADLESALSHLGRPDLVRQLHRLAIARWRYDEFSDTTYLSFVAGDVSEAERLSLFDEAGVNLDMDSQGRVLGLEILDGGHAAARLAAAPSQGKQIPS